MFTTERLILRAVRDDDTEKLRDLWNTEAIQRNLSFDFTVPISESMHKSRLLNLIEISTVFVVIETKENNEFIGFANLWSLDVKNRSLRYGTALSPHFWNKGYATEVMRFMMNRAFVSFGVHRVALNVLSGNAAAIAVYKKIGLVEEGRLREAVWVDGHWQDEVWMGLLQREWLALNPVEGTDTQ